MSGLIPQPIFHKGHNNRGVLLLHGFTGTPLDMLPLSNYLQGIGYSVSVPMLAGHGTSPEQMRRTTWREWLSSAEEGYDQLIKKNCRTVYVAGLSMGGLLALKLAVRREFRAAALLSMPVFVQDTRIKYAKWLKYVVPYLKRNGQKAPHIERQIAPYMKTPMACIASLHELIESTKEELSGIRVPILIAQSGKDETVNPASADYIYEQIGSNYKKIIHYPESSHIITLDHEQHQLFRDIGHFFEDITLLIEGSISRTDPE